MADFSGNHPLLCMWPPRTARAAGRAIKTPLVERLGVRGVLIAFDADEAGDRGAADLAHALTGRGVECYRVELPRGSDVNDMSVER